MAIITLPKGKGKPIWYMILCASSLTSVSGGAKVSLPSLPTPEWEISSHIVYSLDPDSSDQGLAVDVNLCGWGSACHDHP